MINVAETSAISFTQVSMAMLIFGGSRTPLLLSALWVCSLTPALAQCGPGHGGHGGHSSHRAPDKRPEPRPRVTATNARCPVMGELVKPGRDREVIVDERAYLVCCDGCGPELAAHKEKYLDKEGRPLNAREDDTKPDTATKEDHRH